jgi:probable addiction module antidote protein
MPKRTTDFRDELLAELVDPVEAARYLNAALEDSNQMALVALRDVADARQMSSVAEEAGVAREALYRMLCQKGNPTYANFLGILDAVGLKIEFAPIMPVREPVGPAAPAVGAASALGAGTGGATVGSDGPERNEEGASRLGAAPSVGGRHRWKIKSSPRRRGKRATQKADRLPSN